MLSNSIRESRRDTQVEFVGFSTLFEEVSVFRPSDSLFPSHHWKTFSKSNLQTPETHINLLYKSVFWAQFDIREGMFFLEGGRGGGGAGERFPERVGPPLRFNKDTPDPNL